MLVDSHTHIYMRQFDADREQVIQRAFQSGIGALVSIGIDLDSSRASIDLAARYPEIFATIGYHPHDASGLDDKSLAELVALGREPKVVAVGEIGLDFYRNLSPREVQLKAFQRQLELASQLELPVVIHDRDAHEETMTMLRQWVASTSVAGGRLRGVIHCFSGDLAMARECVELGFMVSVPGNVTYPNATQLAEVARTLPIENLMVETDCPFLTPQPFRTKRNEPAYVRLVAEKIAELRGVSFEDVSRITTSNAVTLFNLTSLELSA